MRDLCPRLFPGNRTGCAVFLHIVRTDAEPIVSYLGYIGVPARIVVSPLDMAAGRKLTTGVRVRIPGARNPYGTKTVLSPFRYYESGDKN